MQKTSSYLVFYWLLIEEVAKHHGLFHFELYSMLSLLVVALILYCRNHYSFGLVQESFVWRIYKPRHNILALFNNLAQV